MVRKTFSPNPTDQTCDQVGGYAAPEYAAAVRTFRRLFAGGRGGGALAVSRHGTPVVDVWTGSADRHGSVPWRENTAALSYSTSKGITATVLHILAARGAIDYRAPIAEYWPEFGVAGKRSITVADMLTHRAGLSRIAPLARTVEEMLDHRLMEERLAACAPDRFRGIPAYHALSFGWLVAGLARAVTGKGMGELYRTELAEPLGLDGLYLGRPPAGAAVSVAGSHGSQVPFGISNADAVLARTARMIGPGTSFVRAIQATGLDRLSSGPDPLILRGEMPGANGVFTARALAKVYSTLSSESPLFTRAQVRAFSRIQTYLPDRNLLLPMGWRLGYHSIPVLGAPRAFGHIGFVGSGGWADPDSGLSVGFVHNWLPEARRLPRDQFILLRLLAPIVRAAADSAPAAASLRRAS
ncbi:serine hydrolase domain-containing protein [Nocardia spumae]|uniref:serine hydrolase domain-containing protein n=1 Tax=Nocardia spumae TaxID=2887190 RepID=UPI001D14FDA0|nr:serine hydrolase domain-containing protein [Nocardia spumae]